MLDARLQSCTLGVANLVEVGNYGACVTEDPGERGFYCVKWTSLPCSLQEDLHCTNFCPPMTTDAGELVCKALWLNKVPRTLDWCTVGVIETVVPLKMVVDPIVTLISYDKESNPLPKGLGKKISKEMIENNARRVNPDCYEAQAEEVCRRETHELDKERTPKNGLSDGSLSDN